MATTSTAVATPLCASHSHAAAAWYCPRCQRAWCERCVHVFAAREVAEASCKACGDKCDRFLRADPQALRDAGPLRVQIVQALAYPLRDGGWILVFSNATGPVYLIIAQMHLVGRMYYANRTRFEEPPDT